MSGEILQLCHRREGEIKTSEKQWEKNNSINEYNLLSTLLQICWKLRNFLSSSQGETGTLSAGFLEPVLDICFAMSRVLRKFVSILSDHRREDQMLAVEFFFIIIIFYRLVRWQLSQPSLALFHMYSERNAL